MRKKKEFCWGDFRKLHVTEGDALLVNWSILTDILSDFELSEIFEMAGDREIALYGYLGELRGVPIYSDSCTTAPFSSLGQIFIAKESDVKEWLVQGKSDGHPILEY